MAKKSKKADYACTLTDTKQSDTQTFEVTWKFKPGDKVLHKTTKDCFFISSRQIYVFAGQMEVLPAYYAEHLKGYERFLLESELM